MQQLDTQEDLLQDGIVEEGTADDVALEANTTSPMEGDTGAETEPGTETPADQPQPVSTSNICAASATTYTP